MKTVTLLSLLEESLSQKILQLLLIISSQQDNDHVPTKVTCGKKATCELCPRNSR